MCLLFGSALRVGPKGLGFKDIIVGEQVCMAFLLFFASAKADLDHSPALTSSWALAWAHAWNDFRVKEHAAVTTGTRLAKLAANVLL